MFIRYSSPLPHGMTAIWKTKTKAFQFLCSIEPQQKSFFIFN